jgi:hypothetical protein
MDCPERILTHTVKHWAGSNAPFDFAQGRLSGGVIFDQLVPLDWPKQVLMHTPQPSSTQNQRRDLSFPAACWGR